MGRIEHRTVPAGSIRPARAAHSTRGRTKRPRFEAVVMRYNTVDDYGTRFAPGVFAESLEQRLPRVVCKDKNGRWGFVVDTAEHGGKRRQVRRRGFRTRKEAQAELDRIRGKVLDGVFVPADRQKVGEFLTESWLPAIRSTLEPSTFESYARNVRVHIVPRLGHHRLQKLDAGDLNHFYGNLLEDGRADGRGGLSPRTVRYLHVVLHKAYSDALKWGRVARNPVDAADPPRARDARPPEMRTWSVTTLAAFLDREQCTRYGVAWTFLATTGARRGECLGLRWQDVDLENGTASIRQTITHVGGEVRVAATTKSGKARVINLDSGTVRALKAHRAEQVEERLRLGEGYQDGDLVFCHPDGRPYEPKLFSREFTRRVKRYELPKIRLHDLRHTWATLALESGVHPKIVSERLGHASIAITLDLYSHATPAMKSDAAEQVAGLIFGQHS